MLHLRILDDAGCEEVVCRRARQLRYRRQIELQAAAGPRARATSAWCFQLVRNPCLRVPIGFSQLRSGRRRLPRPRPPHQPRLCPRCWPSEVQAGEAGAPRKIETSPTRPGLYRRQGRRAVSGHSWPAARRQARLDAMPAGHSTAGDRHTAINSKSSGGGHEWRGSSQSKLSLGLAVPGRFVFLSPSAERTAQDGKRASVLIAGNVTACPRQRFGSCASK